MSQVPSASVPSPAPDPAGVRPATRDHVPAIHRLIMALAEFEELADTVTATEADLTEALFGERPSAEALVATRPAQDGSDGTREVVVGFALFFTNYSTFVGRPGFHLEDLFVLPDERGRGTGSALLQALANLARARGCGRLEWMVLDWNERAISFYERCGAHIHREWLLARLTRDGIDAVAASRGG